MAGNLDTMRCCLVNIMGHRPEVTASMLKYSVELSSYDALENGLITEANGVSVNISLCTPSASFTSCTHNTGEQIQEPNDKINNLENHNEEISVSRDDSSSPSTKNKTCPDTSENVDMQPDCESLHSATFTLCPVMDTISSNTEDRARFTCHEPGCNKMFKRQDRLEQHTRIHTGARPYKCDVPGCEHSYSRSQHLTRHKIVSHSNPSEQQKQTVRCTECSKDYSSIYSLRKHKAQFHARRKHSCSECGQLFLKQQHLRTHMQEHSSQPAYKCEFPGCSKAFIAPSKLKRHAEVHKAGRYRCTRSDQCSLTFDRYVDLRQHLVSTHPYRCTVCGVEFTQLSRYNSHRATHEDLRLTYHCTKEGCGRCYYSPRALFSHIRDKHDGEGKLCPCAVCGKKFSTNQKLQQHLKTHSSGCPRRSCSSGQVRKRRHDKGKNRTNYRRLLSSFFSTDGDRSSPTSASRDQQNSLERFSGTRRLLEGSAFRRQNTESVFSHRDVNDRITNGESSGSSDNSTTADGAFKDNLNLQNRSHKFYSDKHKSEHVVGEKIGDVFISGEGAVKESKVLLTKLSDEVLGLLGTCYLKDT